MGATELHVFDTGHHFLLEWHDALSMPPLSLVWAPDPSGHARKDLGNNLARKCLARIPRLQSSFSGFQRGWSGATSIFKISKSYPTFTSCH